MKVHTLTTIKDGERFYERFFKMLETLSSFPIAHVIVDDNDKECEALKSLCAERNVFYVRGLKRGRSQALNFGLDQIRSGPVVIWDIDDLISGEYFRFILENLPGAKQMLSLHPRIEVSENYFPYLSADFCGVHNFDLGRLFYLNVVSHSGLCFNAQDIKSDLQGYSEDLKICVDYDLLLRSYSKGYSLTRVKILNGLFADRNPKSDFKYNKEKLYMVNKFKIDMQNANSFRTVFRSLISNTKIIFRYFIVRSRAR